MKTLRQKISYSAKQRTSYVDDTLDLGTGACTEYARMFWVMATSVGIPNIFVDSSKSNHSWNLVYLDGKWMSIDPTNNGINSIHWNWTDVQKNHIFKYNVRFNEYLDNKSYSYIQSIDYFSEANLDPVKYPKEGYKFLEWNTKRDGTGESYKDKQLVSNLGDTELYAIWISTTPYKIKFNSNGGIGTMKSLTKRAYGKTYKLPKNSFKKPGYTFVGWATSKNGKVKYENKSKIIIKDRIKNNEVCLYAKWISNKTTYKIKYDYGMKGAKKVKNPTKYKVTTKTIKLKKPSAKGYVFDGWYTKKTGGNKVTNIAKGSYGNKKLYARWIKTE